MQDLTNTTFIIPVCIESEDRHNNVITVLGYLNHHFKTNVLIHELSDNLSKLPTEILKLKNLNIKHILEHTNMQYYHRTRQLNEMLNIVTTPTVVNYDIDVLLPVDTYIDAINMIINGDFDVVYPYGDGLYQQRIFRTFNRDKFNINFNLDEISNVNYDIWQAKYGHCMFLNTKKYRESGGENEVFIGYGPEDVERYERFIKLGYKVTRIVNFVYHLEHSRTSFSNNQHTYFERNNFNYDLLHKLNREETIDYYKNVNYIKKYETFYNL